jgi:5-methyltetrahydrofolate--homocysteine methyltransferase
MHRDLAAEAKRRILVGDGAMGTELMKLGLEPGGCPELWNLDAPDKVRGVTAAYVAAGADFVHTNTLGANRWKLEAYGLADRLGEINHVGVDVARSVAHGDVFVVAEVGPTGRLVSPLGDDPRDAFVDVFVEQATAIADAGVDAILLETFVSLDEILAAIEAFRPTNLPIIASMSFSPTAKGDFRTVMGHDIPTAAAALEAAGAAVISANCAQGAETYLPIAKALCAATALTVMVQPNAGMPRLVGGETVFPMTPGEMAQYAAQILRTGVRIFGGCCGTTPQHIRAIRRVVDGLRAS